jgi:integrase
MHKRPPKATTVNHQLAVLSAMLTHAVTLGLLRENPCESVEPLLTEDPEIRYMTSNEEAELMPRLKDGPPWLYDFARVALGTGFRENEVLRLREEDADFARGLLFVMRPKWKKDPRRLYGVPMSAEVRGILQRRAREAVGGYLFADPDMGLPLTRAKVYKAFMRACASAGIAGLHPHSLRHTFGTRLGEADVSVKKIQRLMGHADVTMTLRYIHPGDDSLRSAVEIVVAPRPEIVPGARRVSAADSPKSLKVIG